MCLVPKNIFQLDITYRDVYNILLHATMQVLQEDKYDQIILQMKYVNTFLKKCPIFLEYLSNYK